MRTNRTLLAIACVALGAGCAMLAGKPVIVDPQAVIESGKGCPGCHGTALVCAHPEHPKRQMSTAEVALARINVPEVGFRDCPMTNACAILAEQTGIPIVVALTNRAVAQISVSSELRQQSLMFVLEWMALQQHCRLSITKHSATFVD